VKSLGRHDAPGHSSRNERSSSVAAEEVFERVAGRSAVDIEVPAAELIRRERELRDAS
jgi:hypothetical protein